MFLFTKENAIALVRTVMPFIYAWLLGLAPWMQGLMETLNLTQEGFIVVIGTVVYQLIRWLAEHYPWVGYLLIVNKKPDYGIPNKEPLVDVG